MCHRVNGKVFVPEEERDILWQEERLGSVAGPETSEKTAKCCGVSIKTVQRTEREAAKVLRERGITRELARFSRVSPLRIVELVADSSDTF